MDELISVIGRDTFLAIVVFTGTVIRAGKGEKVDPLHGLIASFTPFFVVFWLIVLLEYIFSWFGLILPAKPLAGLGGLFGFLSNSWLIGLSKNGKQIEDGGALESLAGFVKAVLNFKKQP